MLCEFARPYSDKIPQYNLYIFIYDEDYNLTNTYYVNININKNNKYYYSKQTNIDVSPKYKMLIIDTKDGMNYFLNTIYNIISTNDNLYIFEPNGVIVKSINITDSSNVYPMTIISKATYTVDQICSVNSIKINDTCFNPIVKDILTKKGIETTSNVNTNWLLIIIPSLFGIVIIAILCFMLYFASKKE